MEDKIKIFNSKEAAKYIAHGYKEYKNDEIEIISGPKIYLNNCILNARVESNAKNQLFSIHDINVDGIEHRKGTFDNPYLCEIHHDIIFNGSTITGAIFHYVHFYGSVSFVNCEINTCSFFKVKADNAVYFNDTVFHGNVSFEQCEFNDSLSFHNAKFSNFLAFNFNLCKVNGEFNLSHIKTDLTNPIMDYNYQLFINKGIFSGGLSFKHSHINVDIYISESRVNGLDLSEIIYQKNLVLSDMILTGINMLSSNDEKKHIKSIEISNSLISGDFHIQNYFIESFKMLFCKIESGNRFHICNSTFNSFENLSSTIFGRLDLVNCIVNKTFDMNETSSSGEILLLNSCQLPKINNKHTAMILKKESQKAANIPDYLKYHSIEMNMLYQEKWQDKWNNIPDLIALTFSKCSNNFGLSWERGLFFVGSFSILFFHLINYCGTVEPYFAYGSFSGIEQVMEKYLSLINVFNIINISNNQDGVVLNSLGKALTYLAKIIISYGFFQTGMAFRKFNRK